MTWAWPGNSQESAASTVRRRRALGSSNNSNAAPTGKSGAGNGIGRQAGRRSGVGQRVIAARGAVALVKGLPLPPATPGSGGESGNEFGNDDGGDEFGRGKGTGKGKGKSKAAAAGTVVGGEGACIVGGAAAAAVITNENITAVAGSRGGVAGGGVVDEVGQLSIASPAAAGGSGGGGGGGETRVAFAATPAKAGAGSTPGWLGWRGGNSESGHLTPFRNPRSATRRKPSDSVGGGEGGGDVGNGSTSVPPRPLRRYDDMLDSLACRVWECDVVMFVVWW